MAFLAGVQTLAADSINVVNASFETLPAGGLNITSGCGSNAGCAYDDNLAIAGWTATGSGDFAFGQLQLGPQVQDYAYVNYIPDGITLAYVNNGSIFQTVNDTAIAGVTYTLDVDLDFRKDGLTETGSAFLDVGGNQVEATGTPASPGNRATYTATYTATSGDAGDAITIVLAASGLQADFDNVQLSDDLSIAPEPSTFELLILAATAMFFGHRVSRAL